MTELDFRKANVRDRAALLELQANSIRGVASAFYASEQIEAFLRSASAEIEELLRKAEVWLLADGGRPVASGAWHPAEEPVESVMDVPGGEGAIIRSVFVDPGWIRRGLASRLLDHVEAAAAAAGGQVARLHAMRGSEPLYLARGYRPVGEVILSFGGVPFQGLTMSKPLRRPEGVRAVAA